MLERQLSNHKEQNTKDQSPLNQHRYYRHSGAVPATSTLMMLGIGLAASAVLGLLFELLRHYVVHEVIWVAASFGYGALVGLSVQLASRIAHVRNPKFAMFVAFFIGLFAVYFAWAWYFWLKFNFNMAVLQAGFSQPQFVWGEMQRFAEVGPWTLFDWKPTAGWLYAIWTAEALIVIGFSVGLSAFGSAAYCEACRRWTKKLDLLLHVPLVKTDELKAELEAENYEALIRLVGKPFNMIERIDITGVKCPTCTDANYLTVTYTAVIQQGEQEGIKVEPIVKHLIVPIDVIETLTGQQPAEADDDREANVE